MASDYDEIGLIFINDKETLALFTDLTKEIQGKIILEGLRKSAKPILTQAKANLNAVKKNKSKTNYSVMKTAFKIQNRRKTEDMIGIKIGITKEGYKYRWLEWGTAERYTKKKAYRGKLFATNFFYVAVRQTEEEVKNSVSNEIKLSIERVVKKYANNTIA